MRSFNDGGAREKSRIMMDLLCVKMAAGTGWYNQSRRAFFGKGIEGTLTREKAKSAKYVGRGGGDAIIYK